MGTTHRPTVRGRHFMVASGHSLASLAGVRLLEAGGNAVDAGAAMGLAINVVQVESCNLGGVAPILVYRHGAGDVWQISGLGQYPRGATIDWYEARHGGRIPPGIPATVTPAALGAWVTALDRFGTKRFAEVAAPAMELASGGFPMHERLAPSSAKLAAQEDAPVATRAVYAPGGTAIPVGAPLVQADLGRTFEALAAAEDAAGPDRHQGLQAVLETFYGGPLARQMAAFNRAQCGVLTEADVAGHRTRVEPAPSTTYRGHRVFACGPWCQGPVVLQALNILEGFDLAALRAGGAEHLHVIAQALNAAFADRHAYYGDPEFVRVPLAGLLSKAYATAWRTRLGASAFGAMPAPGDAWAFDRGSGPDLKVGPPEVVAAPQRTDTTYLCVVDGDGNAMSATPSDGAAGVQHWVVPGLGFPVSDRGDQGWLDPKHPAAVAPGKRPRLTPNPGFVRWADGRVMPYGTPGGDVQTQAMTQVLVNLVDFGMSPQAAIEAPRIWSLSFPGSWDPHPYEPGVLVAESRVDAATREALSERGHTVRATDAWTPSAGAVCVARADLDARSYEGGADPRRLSYAIGW
ncbi:MAG: gamma-glutamyltransferase [Actinobacteria bacterium]|nr:gamma-glutamyltransferase [Actinomycetota bacterium]